MSTTEKIVMPQLGESVTEGTISKWLVNVGDKIKKYEPIAEVTTDKVNAEIPSSFSGTIKELVANEGDTIDVGELICFIDTEDVGGEQAGASSPTPLESSPAVSHNGSEADTSMKKRYSPAVLRLSQEHHIDLNQIQGSGKGGRITRKDLYRIIESGELPVEAALKPKQTEQVAVSVQAPSHYSDKEEVEISRTAQPATISTVPGDVEIPLSSVRQAIAHNMVRSKHEAPHAWTMIEVDVTNLVNYRNQLKEDFKRKEGFSLTFLPFFIKAVVEALREHPRVNSMWAGDKIIEKKDINISIAVATEQALYVPVIKNADEKSIKGIAKSVHELASKVRSKRISPNEMQEGTFTVNNTGSFGSIQSQPILNYPQAAILSVEAIVKRPVVMNNGMIAVRDMVNLCLSLDHRILDGLICGRFLGSIKQKLESISPETTSIY